PRPGVEPPAQPRAVASRAWSCRPVSQHWSRRPAVPVPAAALCAALVPALWAALVPALWAALVPSLWAALVPALWAALVPSLWAALVPALWAVLVPAPGTGLADSGDK